MSNRDKRFMHMTGDEQAAFIRAQREAPADTPRAHIHACAGCKAALEGKHLRVNFANPDTAWHQLRFHDLMCLLDFLEDEEQAAGAGVVFTSRQFIDAAAATVPVTLGTGF